MIYGESEAAFTLVHINNTIAIRMGYAMILDSTKDVYILFCEVNKNNNSNKPTKYVDCYYSASLSDVKKFAAKNSGEKTRIAKLTFI